MSYEEPLILVYGNRFEICPLTHATTSEFTEHKHERDSDYP